MTRGCNSAMQWAFIAVAIAACAEGQEIRTTFRVRYVADGAVYIDAGRNAGLSEGFQLTVKRLKPGEAGMDAKPVGDIVVTSLAENSAVCEIKAAVMAFAVGDVAYLSSADIETIRLMQSSKSARKYAQVVSFTEGDPLEEEVREYVPRPPSPEVNRARGRIGFETSTIQGHGPSAAQTTQMGLVLRADISRIGGSFWNFTGYWRGRTTSTGGAQQQTLNDLINRTYTIGLFYNNPTSRYVAGIGRLLLPWASSLSTIDGAYFGRKFGRATLGLFGGSTPDPTAWNYNKDRQIAGAFASFEGGDFDSIRYTSTAGLALTRLRWLAERQFVFLENGIFFKHNFSIYHNLEADDLVKGRLGSTQSGPVISRSFLTMRFQPHRVISFDVNHNYFRNVPTFDLRLLGTGLLEKFLFQGLSAGVRVELPMRVSLYSSLGRSKSETDVLPSWNQMYGAAVGRIWRTGLRADIRHTKFDSSFGHGTYDTASLIRDFGEKLRVELQLGQQNFHSSFTQQNRARFVNSNVDWFFNPHYFLGGGVTIYRGQVQNYDQIFFNIGYRF